MYKDSGCTTPCQHLVLPDIRMFILVKSVVVSQGSLALHFPVDKHIKHFYMCFLVKVYLSLWNVCLNILLIFKSWVVSPSYCLGVGVLCMLAFV